MTLKSRHRFSIPESLQLTWIGKRFIQYRCCSKLKFSCKSAAIKFIQTKFFQKFKEKRFCAVYYCAFCGGWHFSTHLEPGYSDAKLKKCRATRRYRYKLTNKFIQILKANGLLDQSRTFIVSRPVESHETSCYQTAADLIQC